MLPISFGGTLEEAAQPTGSFPRSNTMSQVATESSSPFSQLSTSLGAAVGVVSASCSGAADADTSRNATMMDITTPV